MLDCISRVHDRSFELERRNVNSRNHLSTIHRHSGEGSAACFSFFASSRSLTDLKHDTLAVFDDVEQGVVPAEDIWISGVRPALWTPQGCRADDITWCSIERVPRLYMGKPKSGSQRVVEASS